MCIWEKELHLPESPFIKARLGIQVYFFHIHHLVQMFKPLLLPIFSSPRGPFGSSVRKNVNKVLYIESNYPYRIIISQWYWSGIGTWSQPNRDHGEEWPAFGLRTFCSSSAHCRGLIVQSGYWTWAGFENECLSQLPSERENFIMMFNMGWTQEQVAKVRISFSLLLNILHTRRETLINSYYVLSEEWSSKEFWLPFIAIEKCFTNVQILYNYRKPMRSLPQAHFMPVHFLKWWLQIWNQACSGGSQTVHRGTLG